MDYKNIEVVLTINIGGAQALRGAYDFKQTGVGLEKDEKGNILKFPVGALIIKQLPVQHDCSIRTKLHHSFAEWAISDDARPKKNVSFRDWKNKSRINRLKFHIEQYVIDLYGDAKFFYEIME